MERARAEGVDHLVGPGGLLVGLTKQVLETSLEVEMDEHLGYAKHGRRPEGGANSRNGTRVKTVVTEVGPVEVEVPRGRAATFEPKIVRKRQRRLDGVDAMVISLVAKGLTTGEVQAHLAEVYGTEVSRETISKITDRVLDELAGWQNWYAAGLAQANLGAAESSNASATRYMLLAGRGASNCAAGLSQASHVRLSNRESPSECFTPACDTARVA